MTKLLIPGVLIGPSAVDYAGLRTDWLGPPTVAVDLRPLHEYQCDSCYLYYVPSVVTDSTDVPRTIELACGRVYAPTPERAIIDFVQYGYMFDISSLCMAIEDYCYQDTDAKLEHLRTYARSRGVLKRFEAYLTMCYDWLSCKGEPMSQAETRFVFDEPYI